MSISGSRSELSPTFTVVAIPYEEVVQYVTVVTAAQMNALHAASNSVRTFYGLGGMRWIDTVIAGKTQVRDWSLHVLELRAGIEGVVYSVNAFDSVDAFDISIPAWIDTAIPNLEKHGRMGA